MIDPRLPASQALFTGLDFEGSGLSESHPDSPVQIGLATLDGGEIGPSTVSFLSINHEVTREAYRVHRIDRALCAEAPSLLSFWSTLRDRAQSSVFVSHNAATERRYLKEAFPLWNVKAIPWIDTLKLSRVAWPHADNHQLEALVAQINQAEALHAMLPGRTWHDALFDAVGSLLLLRYFLTLEGWAQLSVEELVRAHPQTWHEVKVEARQKPIRIRRGRASF